MLQHTDLSSSGKLCCYALLLKPKHLRYFWGGLLTVVSFAPLFKVMHSHYILQIAAKKSLGFNQVHFPSDVAVTSANILHIFWVPERTMAIKEVMSVSTCE